MKVFVIEQHAPGFFPWNSRSEQPESFDIHMQNVRQSTSKKAVFQSGMSDNGNIDNPHVQCMNIIHHS